MEDLWSQQIVITHLGNYLDKIRLRPLKFSPSVVLQTAQSQHRDSGAGLYSSIFHLYNYLAVPSSSITPPSSGNVVDNDTETSLGAIYLSEHAWFHFVLHLTELIFTLLLKNCLFTSQFSEWGAMYFQHEVKRHPSLFPSPQHSFTLSSI